MKELSILRRLTAATPKLFIKIQWIIGAISALTLIIIGVLQIYKPESKLILTLSVFAGTLFLIGNFLAKLPVDFEKYKEQLKAELAALEPVIDEFKPILPDKVQEVVNEVETIVN